MRSKGEGSVTYQESKDTWLVKVPIGRYPSGGTQYKTRWAETRQQANQIRIKLLTERENGRLVSGPKETFKTYANWYYENEAGNTMRETTVYQQYNLLKNYVFPYLGDRPIIDITTREITDWMNRLKKKYSTSTVNGARAAMSGVYTSALRSGRVTDHPVSRTQKLRRGQYETTQVQPPYSKEEVLLLLEAAKDSDLNTFINLAVFTGMRRGEILGLRWSDVDWENRTLFIGRTLKEGSRFVPGGGGITEPIFNKPKTLSSQRIVHFGKPVFSVLEHHQLRQRVQKIPIEDSWFDNDLIFTSPCGTAVFPSNYSKRFRNFLSEKGLRHIRIHDLRHTFATLALENGAQLAAITQTLGHSGIEITKNIYAKSVPALEIEATSTINKVLDPEGYEEANLISPIKGISKSISKSGWRAS